MCLICYIRGDNGLKKMEETQSDAAVLLIVFLFE